MMSETLRLLEVTNSRQQVAMSFSLGAMRFATSYWYDSVDFYHLRSKFGDCVIDNVIFHIAAFEINKLCSLRPEFLDWGPFGDYATAEFEDLWRTVFIHVWGQWRYENDDPLYQGPHFAVTHNRPPACVIDNKHQTGILSFFGGGKDSLVAAKLLDSVGASYSTLVYSSSIYGAPDIQHKIIDRLIGFCSPHIRHRQWVFDDFLPAPVIRCGDNTMVMTLASAETPSSIFGALPYVLQHGYTHLCLAHERSADTGQLIWQRTGEDINHQWGKSYAAEKIINAYISKNVVKNIQYFSILKPIHDVVIFSMLREHLDAIAYTHSCNIQKPWCKRCPKCVYVWLNYLAYLPKDVVTSIFNDNLFDVEENLQIIRELLGLEGHMPFECIGQVDEVKLAFELCRSRGLHGKAMDLYLADVEKPDFPKIVSRYTAVDLSQSSLPRDLAPAIAEKLAAAARNARDYIEHTLR